jgi:formamidopyrimidine-DNA glycosylase
VPELPDVTVYVESLAEHVCGSVLEGIRLASPFLLRSVTPPLSEARGREVTKIARLGKRIVISLSGDLHLVLHLMIAGRLRWSALDAAKPRPKPPGKVGLAAFDFSTGTLLLTEAGTKRRASLFLVFGDGLGAHTRGGLEPLGASVPELDAALRRESHTLKRALTDPRILSGIGNAYSDEILHRARISPLTRTLKMNPDEVARLHQAIVDVLGEWTERLRKEARANGGWPEKVTAFRPEMAVHGKFKQPCPVCGSPVQRIVYADNETNYCARCQTNGKLLADRSLSRLLKDDWPRNLDELEELRPK